MRKIDRSELVGTKKGNWIVVSAPIKSERHPKLLCRCKCGDIKPVDLHNFLRGTTSNCRKCSGKPGESNHSWKGFKDIPQHMYGILHRSAKARGIVVEVTIQDLQDVWEKQGGICALSGMPIVMGSKKFGLSASVDRIDSKIGYTKDNIQFVHKDVNLMKNRFDEDYFIEICKRIAKRASGE